MTTEERHPNDVPPSGHTIPMPELKPKSDEDWLGAEVRGKLLEAVVRALEEGANDDAVDKTAVRVLEAIEAVSAAEGERLTKIGEQLHGTGKVMELFAQVLR